MSGRGGGRGRIPVVDATTKAILLVHQTYALHTYIIHSIILKYLKDKLRIYALQKFSSPFCGHRAAPSMHTLASVLLLLVSQSWKCGETQ